MKLLITGAPHAGKTTLAAELAAELHLPLVHTDDWRHLPWEQQKYAVYDAVKDLDAVIVEGVTAVRILRLGWQPTTVLVCEREELESKSHAGIAGLINKRVEEYDQRRVLRIRDAHKGIDQLKAFDTGRQVA